MNTARLVATVVVITSIWAASNVQARARGGKATAALPGVKEIACDVPTSSGRKIYKFRHESDPNWGYTKPHEDIFYIVAPTSPGPDLPLQVILHGAGHDVKKALLVSDRTMHYRTEPGHWGLFVDCRRNSQTDWWWGWHGIKKHPAGAKKYANRFCPTEQRIYATIEWTMKQFEIDENRVYLSGLSMGGSGSLGLGLARGDLFAAVAVTVPAGVEHALWRGNFRRPPKFDPPVTVNFSSHIDSWSRGQEELLKAMQDKKYPFIFAWGTFGHTADVGAANPAALNFPWLSIHKDQAYPVFLDASTNDRYPGFGNKNSQDQQGQINAYFRWKNVRDSEEGLSWN